MKKRLHGSMKIFQKHYLSLIDAIYVAEIDVMFADQKCIVSSEVSLIFPPLIIARGVLLLVLISAV